MNKKEAIKRLDAIENEAKKLRKIIDGSGFDWDFKSTENYVYGDGEMCLCNQPESDDYMIPRVDYFKTEAYTKQSARSMAWNNLLFQLAEYFNPDGWEWVVGDRYYYIIFDQLDLSISVHDWYNFDAMTAKFHPDVIDDVIDELNNNKDKWWHLVTDAELRE